MRFDDQRNRLLQELQNYGITDKNVLKAIETIPRERFVLPEYSEYAYRNQPLPIGLSQTISQPLMIAIMLQHLELKPEDIVLEIGTGSGYQTALLSTLVKEVCSIERLELLTQKARQAITELGFENVYFKVGDGAKGWQKAYPPHKRFSKIIVSAAAGKLPDQLIKQLADPGILVCPVGGSLAQTLIKITNQGGKTVQTSTGAVHSFH
jgi:protein-L-isoaspartate(D-aspartate) O-methyltransferase